MIARFLLLGLIAGVSLTTLTACQDESGLIVSAKELRPLKSEILAKMDEKGMSKDSPVLIRIFKEDSKLEVWKQDKSGRYAFLKDYKICAWGGTIGPKFRQGDYQSPEGFYSFRPANMNPRSSYYLSFDIGYPNAFDKALGRTGGDIMVHGDCSSSGCFSMTDPQVEEIYGLAREAFAGGQQQIQVQSFPFAMTAKNMARVRNNQHFAFWKNIKEGYDHFELTRTEPKVDVCDKRYVFDAEIKDASVTGFAPTAACPSYAVRSDIAEAMQAKTATEDKEFQVAAAEHDAAVKAKAEAEAKVAAVAAEAKAKAEAETKLAANPPKPSFSLFASAPEPAAAPVSVARTGSVPPKAPPAPAAPAPQAVASSAVPWWKKLNPF